MMKSWMIAGAGALLLGAAGVAVAQNAAPPPPPPPPGMDGGPHGPMGGPGGERMGGPHGWHHRMGPPHFGKAAFFRFRKGDASVNIKCAEDEPMKACVEAGSALLDKLAAQPAR